MPIAIKINKKSKQKTAFCPYFLGFLKQNWGRVELDTTIKTCNSYSNNTNNDNSNKNQHKSKKYQHSVLVFKVFLEPTLGRVELDTTKKKMQEQ